jgi:hypothetical protein
LNSISRVRSFAERDVEPLEPHVAEADLLRRIRSAEGVGIAPRKGVIDPRDPVGVEGASGILTVDAESFQRKHTERGIDDLVGLGERNKSDRQIVPASGAAPEKNTHRLPDVLPLARPDE